MNHWLNVITLRFQREIRLKSKCRSNSYLWKYCRKLLNSFHNFFIHPGMSIEYGPSHSDIGAIHMLNKMWNKIKVWLQYFEHKDCGQNLNFDFNMYQDRNIIKLSQWFIILLRNFHRKDCVRRAVSGDGIDPMKRLRHRATGYLFGTQGHALAIQRNTYGSIRALIRVEETQIAFAKYVAY